jgi:hypothetical protein
MALIGNRVLSLGLCPRDLGSMGHRLSWRACGYNKSEARSMGEWAQVSAGYCTHSQACLSECPKTVEKRGNNGTTGVLHYWKWSNIPCLLGVSSA